MRCWLNIHTPLPQGDNNRRKNDRQSFLQEKGRHFIDEVRQGDYAVIYETATVENNGTIIVNGKRLKERAYEPRGGIVALVKINTDFQAQTPYDYNGRVYIGYFDGECILKSENIEQPLVPLSEIDEAWVRDCNRHFVPHLNGGFRELKPDECRAVMKLLNVQLSQRG